MTAKVHGPTGEAGRAYCGRKAQATHDWSFVTCIDCLAALRADHEAGVKR